ncbi:hypothetical protein [Sporosarcina sp. FSL K6-2383]|uniref:hypothetical protein n=1 Tax=Sporosarcina sp. FSL K6-2383 TaxID=2921556 RepID=UPI00315A6BB2
MGEYFTTRVKRGSKEDLDKRVAELVADGFEVVGVHNESETRKMFDLNPDSRGPKKKFANDFTTHKYVAVLRRKNTRVHA